MTQRLCVCVCVHETKKAKIERAVERSLIHVNVGESSSATSYWSTRFSHVTVNCYTRALRGFQLK